MWHFYIFTPSQIFDQTAHILAFTCDEDLNILASPKIVLGQNSWDILAGPFRDVASCPHNIILPLAGMCGGGSSGSSGGATVTLLSVFCLVSFLWALGEELEELLELVTVSPELYETEGRF